MNVLRAFFASLIASTLLGAGLLIVAKTVGAPATDLVEILDLGRTPFFIVCFLAAWIAAVFGVLGVLAAFLAFIAPEEDENDPRLRRRGFPKSAPLLLIALSLAAAWFALRCASTSSDDSPIAIAVEPAANVGKTPLPDGAEPDSEPTPLTPPLSAPPPADRPAPTVEDASYEWRYMYPLPRASSAVWSDTALPFNAQSAAAERLFCNKAWIAVTGSSSEEGPAERNRKRSRLRTLSAMSRAKAWLAAHPGCGDAPVMGIDLGQHIAVVAATTADPSASAYQRRVFVVSRSRARSEGPIEAATARAELEAFLTDPSNMAQLLAGRRFSSEPQIVEN